MQKNVILPVIGFFVVVCSISLCAIPEQTYRNVYWSAIHSNTTMSFLTWFPCIVILIPASIFSLFVWNGVVGSAGSTVDVLDIGDETEPMETDENGYIIAYRYYRIDEHNNLYSMTRKVHHPGGYLEADKEPAKDNTNGIYAAKKADSPILNPYKFYAGPNQKVALVEVRLWGDYVEGKKGYRAHKCQAQKIIKTYGTNKNGGIE